MIENWDKRDERDESLTWIFILLNALDGKKSVERTYFDRLFVLSLSCVLKLYWLIRKIKSEIIFFTHTHLTSLNSANGRSNNGTYFFSRWAIKTNKASVQMKQKKNWLIRYVTSVKQVDNRQKNNRQCLHIELIE